MSAILLVGYSLFWTIMTLATCRQYDATTSRQLHDTLSGGRWPPLGLPVSWRLPLPSLVWLFLLLLALSGIWLLTIRGVTLQHFLDGSLFGGRFGQLLGVKLLLVALFLVNTCVLCLQRLRWIVHVNLFVVLTIVVVSAVFVR